MDWMLLASIITFSASFISSLHPKPRLVVAPLFGWFAWVLKVTGCSSGKTLGSKTGKNEVL